MAHKLYIVGTPIGNLQDMTPQARRILKQVGLIASENPTKTQRLLSRFEIQTPMMRFTDAYDRRKHARTQAVLEALTRMDVALVSEAGMPLLADPGYELIQAVRENGIEIVAVPGPTALMTALMVSGLPTSPFVFLGFPPRRSKARLAFFTPFATDERTLVIYESPHRLQDTINDALAALGVRQVALCNELTKLYEHVWRGTLDDAAAYVKERSPRGEYALVIGGVKTAQKERE